MGQQLDMQTVTGEAARPHAASGRAGIERELQERLARRRSPDIQLVCGDCQCINDADSRFCKHCGLKYNVTVRFGAPVAAGDAS